MLMLLFDMLIFHEARDSFPESGIITGLAFLGPAEAASRRQ